MAGLEPRRVATHVVRNHRSLRRRLPTLTRLAVRAADPGSEQARLRAAWQGAAFLDRDVLAHADVEDVLVDRYLDGRPQRGEAVRLQPQHDTLREASARLHDFVDSPSEALDVGGMLHGVAQVLDVHLDEEWRVLAPALSALDSAGCAGCEPMEVADAAHPTARMYLPTPFAQAQRLLTRASSGLGARAAVAASTAVRRLARQQGVPVREDPYVVVELAPCVQSEHVALHLGRLSSRELETVVTPVEFELVLSPRGDRFTELEVHHTLAPTRPVPPDAPAHELTAAAVHAMVGELAAIAGDRPVATHHH